MSRVYRRCISRRLSRQRGRSQLTIMLLRCWAMPILLSSFGVVGMPRRLILRTLIYSQSAPENYSTGQNKTPIRGPSASQPSQQISLNAPVCGPLKTGSLILLLRFSGNFRARISTEKRFTGGRKCRTLDDCKRKMKLLKKWW